MSFQVTPPRKSFEVALEDRATAGVRVHGKPGGIRLYLSHGNGFAIDGYAPFWAPLAARFELIVFDQRNHGLSAPSDPEHHRYAYLARDLERIRREVDAVLGGRPSVGVFHSMSARAAMIQALEGPWLWDALLLFDPPNLPPESHDIFAGTVGFDRRLSDWAGRRQECFATPVELASHFRKLRAHQNWCPEAYGCMANAILTETPKGWRLCCPPTLEQALYLDCDRSVWPRTADFAGPVLLVGADPALEAPMPTAQINQALAEAGGFDYVVIKNSSHMMQLEAPAACRGVLGRYLDRLGLVAHH